MRIILIAILAISFYSCSNNAKSHQKPAADSTKTVVSDSLSDEQLTEEARLILQYFNNKEYDKLAKSTGSEGLRFSPYAFIDTTADVVLSADQLRKAATSKEKLVWGNYDGSGEPIKMTIAEYFADFVYDTDFLKKGEVSVNEFTQRGNTTNNIKEAYTGCVYVDFLIRGEKAEFDGIDWKAIRIVFRLVEGKAVLVGVVHDEWTI